MNIAELPNDIFLLIVAHLSPQDLILNRRVCKQFNEAFTELDLNRHVLLQHYPRAQEVRNVDQESVVNWSNLFAKAAGRYHHLKKGVPAATEKWQLGKSLVVPKWAANYPVASWHRHLQYEEKKASFQYPDSLWTYADGVLVFPSAKLQRYVLYDLNSRQVSDLDFEPVGKIVRRMRLDSRILIIEWCEHEPYHQLNENEMVYRHFATAYDVKQTASGKCLSTFRNEWKIHFLGMPLNSRDRFFSTHNATHYALYLWQPNRSSWGEDEPIEALAIWDISSPSKYRPSLDPTGKEKPDEHSHGPQVIRRLSYTDLGFYRIRQRACPVLRSLELDENHVYVVEEDHCWIVGQQASHTLPRLHKVKTTGVPFYSGPHWKDECGADGDVNRSYCQRSSDISKPNMAPCWRHQEFPYLTITQAIDEEAGVSFSARHCFMLETISINIKPKVQMVGPGYELLLKDDLWQQLLAKGKICGNERWLIGENNDQELVILRFDTEKQYTLD